MGRNPVVGRQGPAYHAAAVLTEKEAAQIKVTQIRSGIGHSDTMRKTLVALGLKKHQSSSVLPNNASVRGMVFKVRHLVEVSPAKEK